MSLSNFPQYYIQFNLKLFLYLLVISVFFTCDAERQESESGNHNDIGAKKTGTESSELFWQVDYDENNRYSSFIDPAGRETKLHYDLMNSGKLRNQTIEYPDGSKVRYEYDEFERRVSMTDGFGKVNYEYDGFNRLIAVHREKISAIYYSYDTMNRLNSMSVGDEFRIEYRYDFLGRLSKMRTPAGDITYEYQTGQGMIFRTLPNGIKTIWEYYPEGSLKEITHLSSSNEILLKFTYSYRADGLIGKIEEYSFKEGNNTLNYEYDKVQRLVSFSDSRGKRIDYKYDKLGNRTEIKIDNEPPVMSAFDRQGRMTQHNGQECSYDDAGNLLSYIGRDGQKEFEYNTQSLIKSANKGEIQYQYDGDGFLIYRKAGDNSIKYIADPLADIWRPLLATENNREQRYYIWENNFPTGIISNGEFQFLLHDHLGSIRSITNKNGKVTDLFAYNPFGVPEDKHADNALCPGFTGLFYETSASVYLTRARAYDPNLGKFMQIDQQSQLVLGSQKNIIAYNYCGNDPLNFLDHSGNEPSNFEWLFEFDKNYYTGLPTTCWEGIKGIWDFYRPSNLAKGFRGGWEFGTPHPGTWAEQAERFSDNPFWKGLVQFVLAQSVLMEIDVALGGILPKTLPKPHYRPLNIGKYKIGHLGVGERAYFGAPHLGLIQKLSSSAKKSKAIFHFYLAKAFIHLNGKLKFDIPYALPLLFKKKESRGSSQQGSRNESSDKTSASSNFLTIPNGKSNGDDGEGGGGGGCGGGPKRPPDDIIPSTTIPDPSNVGGIYLRGIGKALENLGSLIGLALDESNGRLVLISKEQGEIKLPPLRLDDVVTIFRSVYQYGDAPYVSIDPNPKDPQGKIMLVRHGPGTDSTYAGWVLFEADRVMKAYSLGTDNISNKKVTSHIRSYQSLLDLGFSNFNDNQRNPIWERFWIVPAEVNRQQTRSKNLTLFDVPLKVNTQRMELQDGKLVPARNQKPSKEAATFSAWFTANYDKIASEAFTQPPAGAGIDSLVSCFWELRRVALIAAMAENLRDQGISLPFWMRDYKIEQCSVPKTTPAIIVSGSRGSRILQIYGGVNLSPSDNNIHTTNAGSLAETIEKQALHAITGAKLFSSVSFMVEGKKYQAVALPGSETKDLSASVVEEVDMVIPVQGDRSIALVRKFNSFFKPNDIFGNVWTLDLPRLEAQNIPTKREGDAVVYKVGYQLITPLNSYTEYFTKLDNVAALNSELLVPNRPGPIWGLANDNDSRIGFPTQVAFFRNGSKWHFNNEGNLVATDDDGLMVQYCRDQSSYLTNIEGWYGAKKIANIQLAYDSYGRLASASGSYGQFVKYSYDMNQNLSKVEQATDKTEYEYGDGLLTGIKFNNTLIRSFKYTNNGKLLHEKGLDGRNRSYKEISDKNGYAIESTDGKGTGLTEKIQYDNSLRPLHQIFENGSEIQWTYSEAISMAEIKLPGGERYILKQNPDGSNIGIQTPEGGALQAFYDENSRLIRLEQNQRQALKQIWRSDGKLEIAIYETFAYHPEYKPDGTLNCIIITPPEEESPFRNWLSIIYDEFGRPQKMDDYTGFEEIIGYDKSGNLSNLVTNQTRISFNYNEQGNLNEIKTSWGYKQQNYYDSKSNVLSKMEINQDNEKSFVLFKNNRLQKIHQFDGGEYNFLYGTMLNRAGFLMAQENEDDSQNRLTQIADPNDLILNYDYTPSGQIASINVGGAMIITYHYNTGGCMTCCSTK